MREILRIELGYKNWFYGFKLSLSHKMLEQGLHMKYIFLIVRQPKVDSDIKHCANFIECHSINPFMSLIM